MSEEKKTKKIRFSVNTHYEGNLVGPGTEFETIDVDEFWADHFIEHNAAKEVIEPKAPVQTNQSGQGGQQSKQS